MREGSSFYLKKVSNSSSITTAAIKANPRKPMIAMMGATTEPKPMNNTLASSMFNPFYSILY